MFFLRLLKLLSGLPLTIQYRVADIVCLFIAAFPNRTARLIDQNLALCIPQRNRSAHKTLCRSTLKQSIYSALELAAVWYWPADNILAKISQTQVCDEFYQSEKSRIVIVPHLGCWELLILWLARQKDFLCLYKPQKNPSVDRFILDARSRNGAQMFPVDSTGLRQLSKGLKQKKTAMILPDQKPRKYKARVMVNFFDHPAPTSPLIHNLCSRFDCDVFIAAIFRDTESSEFTIRIDALNRKILGSEQEASLNYMNAEIERLIMRHPEQYQWGYSRFQKDAFRDSSDDNE